MLLLSQGGPNAKCECSWGAHTTHCCQVWKCLAAPHSSTLHAFCGLLFCHTVLIPWLFMQFLKVFKPGITLQVGQKTLLNDILLTLIIMSASLFMFEIHYIDCVLHHPDDALTVLHHPDGALTVLHYPHLPQCVLSTVKNRWLTASFFLTLLSPLEKTAVGMSGQSMAKSPQRNRDWSVLSWRGRDLLGRVVRAIPPSSHYNQLTPVSPHLSLLKEKFFPFHEV